MICVWIADRVSVSWRRLESIRMCWGYKYLPPTLQGAPRRRVKALNGISGLHPLRQIDRVIPGVHTILGKCDTSHTARGMDPMMKAKVDLPGHLPDPLSPRHTPETP